MKKFGWAVAVGVGAFLVGCSGADPDSASQNGSVASADGTWGGSSSGNGGSSSGGSSGSSSGGDMCRPKAYDARGVIVDATVLRIPLRIEDTGKMKPEGGHNEATLATLEIPKFLKATALSATADGDDGKAKADATVADVNVDVGALDIGALLASVGDVLGGAGGPGGGLLGGLGGAPGGGAGGLGGIFGSPGGGLLGDVTGVLGATRLSDIIGDLRIHADVVKADSEATCSHASGSSTLANLKVNDGKITVSGEPNQEIDLLGGSKTPLGLFVRVTINEQIPDTTAGHRGMKVNAIHVKVGTNVKGFESLADAVVSSADANVSCSCH